jgi:hypothetical protein
MTDPVAKAEAIHPPPMHPVVSREKGRAAVQRIRARAAERKAGHFDRSKWKAWRDEGRGKRES